MNQKNWKKNKCSKVQENNFYQMKNEKKKIILNYFSLLLTKTLKKTVNYLAQKEMEEFSGFPRSMLSWENFSPARELLTMFPATFASRRRGWN